MPLIKETLQSDHAVTGVLYVKKISDKTCKVIMSYDQSHNSSHIIHAKYFIMVGWGLLCSGWSMETVSGTTHSTDIECRITLYQRLSENRESAKLIRKDYLKLGFKIILE